ncbi:hypothetical protein LTR28_009273, partial [Elasticomyces elasticus]
MGDPLSAITQGAMSRVFSGEQVIDPVLQCVQIKPMASNVGGERYRVVFSDVTNFIQSMMAQQANWVITEGKLKKGSIVRLKSFQSQEVKGKPYVSTLYDKRYQLTRSRIIVVMEVEVLEQYGECEKIGLPVALEITPKAEATTQQAVKEQPGSISSNNFYGQKAQQPTPQATSRTLPSRPNNTGSTG